MKEWKKRAPHTDWMHAFYLMYTLLSSTELPHKINPYYKNDDKYPLYASTAVFEVEILLSCLKTINQTVWKQ